VTSKYRNVRTVIDGVSFDSKAEARRYATLKLLERAGEITDLRRQVAYELLPSVKYASSTKATGPTKYLADFVYIDKDGNQIIEDVKGGPDNPVFKLKRKLMRVLLGLEISISR
jgi:hypothetical protein